MPVAKLQEGEMTSLDDLSLVCANCHRVLHRVGLLTLIAEWCRLMRPQLPNREAVFANLPGTVERSRRTSMGLYDPG